MSKYWTLSHENVEARIVLSPHNIKLLLFNLEWRFKLPSTEENKLNFGIKTNHIMMLDDHNAKVQFFLSNFILLSASVVFFLRFCEAGGLTIIHKRTNNMVTHDVSYPQC